MSMNVSGDPQGERDKNRRQGRKQESESKDRDRDRDRSPREKGRNVRNRVFVSNVPYEYRWSDVKDLFRKHVGDVEYVDLFTDEKDKPRGCGIVEFSSVDSVKKAMEVMHRFPIDGRKLVIKEDFGNERDKHGYVLNGSRDDSDRGSRGDRNRPGKPPGERFNTYGLSLQFLDSIGVNGPLLNKVFVANLDYKVDKAKLKEIFKMAGKVRNIDLSTDKEGNSRGFAVLEYDHPVEAVQAISMFDKQMLYDRKLTVRMDRVNAEKLELRLPDGLKGIGVGLGTNGEPLRDVARHIAQMANNSQNASAANQSGGILGALPPSQLGQGNMNATAFGASFGNSMMGSNLGFNLGSLNQLQTQYLQQNMANSDIGLNSGNVGIGNSMQDLSPAQIQNSLANQGSMGNFNRPMGMSQVSGFNNNSNAPRPSVSGNFFGGQQGANASASVFGNNGGGDDDFGNKKTSETIKISNLPTTMTWQLIREKFSEAGDIKFADKTGKDTAIVRYLNEWSASRAIKTFDKTRIDGRTIEVRFC